MKLTKNEQKKYLRMIKKNLGKSKFNTEIKWCEKTLQFVAVNDWFMCSFNKDQYGNMENILINQKTGAILEYDTIINEYGEVNQYMVKPLQNEIEQVNNAISFMWK